MKGTVPPGSSGSAGAPADLSRFHAAHARPHGGYAVAIAELRAGRKRSHWSWWIFPQLRGLGRSDLAVQYGLDGLGEARAWLADDLLRAHLFEVAEVVDDQLRRGIDLHALVGEIDAWKLASCLTLFRGLVHDEPGATAFREATERILAHAATLGIPACRYTLDALRGG